MREMWAAIASFALAAVEWKSFFFPKQDPAAGTVVYRHCCHCDLSLYSRADQRKPVSADVSLYYGVSAPRKGKENQELKARTGIQNLELANRSENSVPLLSPPL
jgi:hypothetical protein